MAAARDGSVFLQGSVQIPDSKILGTVGVGDAFAAGVLYGFHEGMTIKKNLQTGVCIAASCLLHLTTSGRFFPSRTASNWERSTVIEQPLVPLHLFEVEVSPA